MLELHQSLEGDDVVITQTKDKLNIPTPNIKQDKQNTQRAFRRTIFPQTIVSQTYQGGLHNAAVRTFSDVECTALESQE
jgi:hypothetical protein